MIDNERLHLILRLLGEWEMVQMKAWGEEFKAIVKQAIEANRLRARVEALTEALRPFAWIGEREEYQTWSDSVCLVAYGWAGGVNLGDCRKAAALLKEQP